MAAINLRAFAGMQPSANPKSLPDSASVLTRNLELRYGDFRPLPQPSNLGVTVAPGSTLYRFHGSPAFISNTNVVDYVRGPIPNDSLERTYYTGDGAPKVIDNVGDIRPLGLPAPTTAPIVTITSTGSYSSIDSEVDQAAKLTEILGIIKASYTQSYDGLTDADLGINFVHLSDTPIWAGTFKIPGTLSNGQFSPTNSNHLLLVDERLGFGLTTYNGATIGRVDLEVRGQRDVFDYEAMKTALAAVLDPSDSTGTKKLLTLDQITQIQQAIRDSIASADSAFNSNVARLHDLFSHFMAVANTGNPTSTASVAAMANFFALIKVQVKIVRAIVQAREGVFAAMNTYNKAP